MNIQVEDRMTPNGGTQVMGNSMENCHYLPGEKPTVLIVDDSKAVRIYVEEILGKEGYSVSTACDGFSGLESINRDHPDVILLDVEMPGMNGLEVLDVLRADQQLSSIILFTTLSSLENRVQGLNMGADDYIAKPFAESELLARVRAGLRTALLKKELASARNRAQDALERLNVAQKRIISEQKLVAVAGLAAGVAHQINNPLGFIQSNLNTLLVYLRKMVEGSDLMLKMSVLLREAECGFQNEVDEMLDWMMNAKLDYIRRDIEPLIAETREGGERIASIVRSLQLLDQADAVQKMEMEELGEVVSSVVSTCRMGLQPGVSLLADVGGVQTNARCNRVLLHIALDNILQNAVEAVGDKGEIQVRLFENGPWAFVQVLDTGDGVPPEKLGKLFDPFFTTSESPKSAGLGLTVAQSLVHAHGGHIQISSEPGRGTNVTVALPVEANNCLWDSR
jgi:two-component system NtrC family sensor kinase